MKTICNFKSWRFSNIIFSKLLPSTATIQTLINNNDAIREAFRKVVPFANQHGGWDVIGWYRRGTKADSSSTTTQNAGNMISQQNISEHTEIHIIYLFPTNFHLFHQDDAFTSLLLDPNTLA